MTSIGDSGKIGIIPYAVNMPLLFECYARKRIKDKLKEIAPRDECEARMLKFVANKRGIDKTDDEYGCMSVMKDKDSECYIAGSVVPDIVIEYTCKEGNKEEKFYRIYDVKYKWSKNKNSKNKNSARDDRLQLLAYEFMYNCDNNLGFIFPKQKFEIKNKSNDEINDKKSFIIVNQPGEDTEQCDDSCKSVFSDKFYVECYLGSGEITDVFYDEDYQTSYKDACNGWLIRKDKRKNGN
jgi:hypothetical protein